jgi:glutamate-ammonia-ligase adenylyltransferase
LAAAGGGIETRRQALNAFKDREMFRIDMRHIMKYTSRFGQFSRELTDLAEMVVDAAFRLCEAEMRNSYGEPQDDNGDASPMVVCALGKAGGRELGFASDIELMFVYEANGKTTGPDVVTTAEFYEKLVAEFVRTIQARHEGIFEIDLQLRPYGKAGSMAVSLDAFRRYFAPGGPAWAYERQALVKLRPIAGDAGVGQRLEAERNDFVYTGEVFDVAAMRAMRERQLRHLVTPGTINAKFSPGCLVDVEYLVQGLQINYGPQYPSVRQSNTREAMAALNYVGALEHSDYQRLREAHTFLRRVINGLRMVRGHAKDLTVPNEGSEEFAFLARRMGYSDDPTRLRDDLTHQTVKVQELSARLLDALAHFGQTESKI